MDLSFTKIHIFYIEPLLPEKYETVSASKYDFYPHAIFANENVSSFLLRAITFVPLKYYRLDVHCFTIGQ